MVRKLPLTPLEPNLLQILTQVITQRNRIIDESSKSDELDNDNDITPFKEPSAEVLAKIADYSNA